MREGEAPSRDRPDPMRLPVRRDLVALTLPFALALPGARALAADAVAEMKDADGESIGTVEFTETPAGLHVVFDLEGIPEGVHGVHVHETGDCSAADFASAGGHLAGGRPHGFLTEGGPHPGDFPNAHVGADGRLTVEYVNDLLTLGPGGEGAMLDADGAGVIVHSGPDDYASQPSGEAGDRIACGVVTAAGG